MGKIDELIKELCPDGVEYVKLGEICEIYDGTHQTPKYVNEGIPFISVENIQNIYGSQKFISIDDYDSYKVKPQLGDMFMTRIGTIGTCAIVNKQEDIAYYVSLALLRPKHSIVNVGYLKHLIESNIGVNEIRKHSLLHAVPIKINKNDICKIQIPLPPLSIQQQIVEILDTFTDSISNLQEELELREKQMEYYRESLLSFDGEKVEYIKLSEICNITDYVAAGSFASLREKVLYLKEGYAHLVRTTDLKQNFKNKEDFVYVSKEAFDFLWRVNLNCECVILPNIGNCGEVYYISPNVLKHTFNVLGPNAIKVESNNNNNKFLFYLFHGKDFQNEIRKITSKAGQPKFNKTNLKEIRIPVPSLSRQQEIVNILDTFESMIANIKEEIELRQKQYEYYREKLLTFERKEA